VLVLYPILCQIRILSVMRNAKQYTGVLLIPSILIVFVRNYIPGLK
jgi:hypothetical protein